jgi:hypothetical protein
MPPARSAAAVVRQIGLWAGLVLFTYLTTHLLNHAFGLISIDAMLAGGEWFVLLAGLDVSDHARHELTVRDREAPLAVFVAPSAGRLAERLAWGGDRVEAVKGV